MAKSPSTKSKQVVSTPPSAAERLAERASKAASVGKIGEARRDFTKALKGTKNLRVLELGYEFFESVGELGRAEQVVRRWLTVATTRKQTDYQARAYGRLGWIELKSG